KTSALPAKPLKTNPCPPATGTAFWARGGGGGGVGGGVGVWGGGWGRPGFWGGYWNRPWFAAPIAWGLGAWALGSVIFDSGYASYSNPYYASTTVISSPVYDYSQPIQVVAEQPVATDAGAQPAALPPEVQTGTAHVQTAQDAFRQGDYATAMKEIELALAQLPKDAALHEFRGLVQFAMQKYSDAAGTLYAVLSAGPGWDWTTLSSMYPSVDVYTQQLRALEDFVKSHPDSADARFVLAYHYITCNHPDSAVKQLREVVRLQPKDQLSAQLLKMMGGDAPADAGAQPAPAVAEGAAAPQEPPAPPPIDPAKIVGNWAAKRDDGSSFALKLTPDAKFTWTFEQGGRKQEFGGTYEVDEAVLVLTRQDGATMPGMITMAQNGFNFQLFGAPPGDPGLDFKKG
ncbi:MAG: tetratricopeptide repeat protein, partial [Planctomycetaceae bacterium]